MTPGLAAAGLTAFFYGITPVCARRAIRLLGYVKANLARLAVAVVVMGVLAFTVGRGVGDHYAMFAAAGALGFGVGGLAMFRALPLLGAPLASLVVETTAAFAAAFLALVWFADAITGREIAFSLVILAGVVLGLLPYVRGTHRPRVALGAALAVLAALAQAGSAVVSRRALLAIQQAENAAAGGQAPPVGRSIEHVATAAFDRLTGGVAVALAALVVVRLLAGRRAWAKAALAPAPGVVGGRGPRTELGPLGSRLPDRAWFWVGANALFGPILGVTAMVWALQTMQPGVVQAVAAMAPLIAIPFARWLEGYRPPAGYYPGAVIAVVGLAGLALSA